MRYDIVEKIDDIKQWLADGLSISSIAKKLNCKLDTLKRYLADFNISYVIDQGSGNRGKRGNQTANYKSLDTVLVKTNTTPSMKAGRLKEKLFSEGVKQKTCECCGLSSWLGEPIPLELHHIDGDKTNNTLENLQVLCPNCHAKTDNYRGKNIKSARAKRENAGLVKLENTTDLSSVAQAYEFDSRIPHHIYPLSPVSKLGKSARKPKSSDEYNKLVNEGRVDSNGRANKLYLSTEEWLARRELIINSGVDLLKHGWKHKVCIVTGLTRKQLDLTIAHFADFFKDLIYIRLGVSH